MELRGHEHTIEVVVFAPPAAYAAIRELAGIPVGQHPPFIWRLALTTRHQNTERSKRPGAYLATGSRDKTIKLWDTQSGQMLRSLVSILPVLFLSRL